MCGESTEIGVGLKEQKGKHKWVEEGMTSLRMVQLMEMAKSLPDEFETFFIEVRTKKSGTGNVTPYITLDKKLREILHISEEEITRGVQLKIMADPEYGIICIRKKSSKDKP